MIRAALLATIAAFSAAPAAATETLLRHKDWIVTYDRFDDGEPYCSADTYSGPVNFSLYFSAHDPLMMIFIFDDVVMTPGLTDFSVRIDDEPVWDFSNAQRMQTSVAYQLVGGPNTAAFIDEIMKGSHLYMLGSGDVPIKAISLAGASAAIAKLGECRSYIEGG